MPLFQYFLMRDVQNEFIYFSSVKEGEGMADEGGGRGKGKGEGRVVEVFGQILTTGDGAEYLMALKCQMYFKTSPYQKKCIHMYLQNVQKYHFSKCSQSFFSDG